MKERAQKEIMIFYITFVLAENLSILTQDEG